MNKREREQEGIIHVYFRANGRYTVFYDDEDNLELLRRMDKMAKKYESKVLEFALMGNHAHFLIETLCVTELMRETLKSYSRWYNRKYKNSNKVFATPFSSACKRSDEWVLSSGVYILQNPVVAGMCSKIENYRWSSASMHFKEENKFIPIGYRWHLQLCSVIEVDTSYMDRCFNNYDEFLSYTNLTPILKSAVIPKHSKWETCTIEKLTAEVSRILNGRLLNNLTKEEIKELILRLGSETNARMMHIASVLHIDYSFVRQCLTEAPQPE